MTTTNAIPLDDPDAWCCEPHTTVDIEVVRSVLRDMERYQREASDELSARFANLAHIIARLEQDSLAHITARLEQDSGVGSASLAHITARLEQDDVQRLSHRRVVNDATLEP